MIKTFRDQTLSDTGLFCSNLNLSWKVRALFQSVIKSLWWCLSDSGRLWHPFNQKWKYLLTFYWHLYPFLLSASAFVFFPGAPRVISIQWDRFSMFSSRKWIHWSLTFSQTWIFSAPYSEDTRHKLSRGDAAIAPCQECTADESDHAVFMSLSDLPIPQWWSVLFPEWVIYHKCCKAHCNIKPELIHKKTTQK